MPAAIMWARGLDDRPVDGDLRAAGRARTGQVATQLHAGIAPLEFTAPNLQYLMDSPAEFGPISDARSSPSDGRTFRFALHHTGTDAELDALVKDVEKIVRAGRRDLRRVPEYEPALHVPRRLPAVRQRRRHGAPQQHGDDRRRRRLRATATRLLDTVAHEFFHCWNVERIRPKGSSRSISIARTCRASSGSPKASRSTTDRSRCSARGSWTSRRPRARSAELIESVVERPGTSVRSAEEMSRMAPFIDGGRSIDRTNWSTTFISYYPFGGAIALALDLTLRDRSDGRVSLDDFMRAMWRTYGKPGGSREGYVDRPYTIADAEATLAEVSGDRAFARDFFARYIQGHDVADYARLLARAGLHRAQAQPGTRLARRSAARVAGNGARVAELVAPTWPIYAAGLDEDDELQQLDGQRISGDGDVARSLQRHKPGDTVPIVFVDRTGVAEDGERDAGRGSAYRSRAGRTRRLADRGAEGVPRRLAGSEVDGLFPGFSSSTRRSASPNFARSRKIRQTSQERRPVAAARGRRPRRPGGLEARLAGVVVAALKEAFDRDTQRLELEREQLDAERQRAERALRLELRRQAARPRNRPAAAARGRRGCRAGSGRCSFSARLIGGPTRRASRARHRLAAPARRRSRRRSSAQSQVAAAVERAGDGDDSRQSIPASGRRLCALADRARPGARRRGGSRELGSRKRLHYERSGRFREWTSEAAVTGRAAASGCLGNSTPAPASTPDPARA